MDVTQRAADTQSLASMLLSRELSVRAKEPPGAALPSPDGGAIEAYDALDATLDLSSDRGGYDPARLREMSPEARQKYLSMLSAVLKMGYIGYVTYDINGQPYKTDISTDMVDLRTRGERYWDDRRVPPAPQIDELR